MRQQHTPTTGMPEAHEKDGCGSSQSVGVLNACNIIFIKAGLYIGRAVSRVVCRASTAIQQPLRLYSSTAIQRSTLYNLYTHPLADGYRSLTGCRAGSWCICLFQIATRCDDGFHCSVLAERFRITLCNWSQLLPLVRPHALNRLSVGPDASRNLSLAARAR